MSHHHYALTGSIATLIIAATAAADVIGQWHFDEAPGETVATESVLGNDATLSGSIDFVTDGIAGNALFVETIGNGLATVGNLYDLSDSDFSIVVWVRTAPDDTSQTYIPMARHHSGTQNGYIIAINPSGTYGQVGKAWFYESDSPGNEMNSTTTVTDGEWHQVVGTHEHNGNSTIYVDGAPIEDIGPSLGSNGNNVPLLFGGIQIGSTPTSLMNGWIDEAQIYDHILRPCEVQYLFENPAATVAVDPCPADLDDSGAVNVDDLLSLLAQWGSPGGPADINCDLTINVDDLLELLSSWGPC